MRSADVKVGVDYAHNRYGRQSGRFKPPLGHKALVKVTVVAPPRTGMVDVWTHDDPEMGVRGRSETVKVGALLGTWADHEAAAAGAQSRRDDAIEQHKADDARVRELLGPVYDEYDYYIEFEVYDDGSYPTSVRKMPRSAFRAMLEAAYENGKAARDG